MNTPIFLRSVLFFILTIILTITLTMSLTSCGQKGPLFLSSDITKNTEKNTENNKYED